MGSEMCISDNPLLLPPLIFGYFWGVGVLGDFSRYVIAYFFLEPCLLYTSDAADEEDSVDLGGRRLF